MASISAAAAIPAARNPQNWLMPTRNAPDPPVVATSASEWPAKDWPRSTVNTPMTPEVTATTATDEQGRPDRAAAEQPRLEEVVHRYSPATTEHPAVHPDHVHLVAVQPGEALRGDHLVGRAGGGVASCDVHDPVHDAEQRVHVVRGEQHGDLLLAGQLAEHRDDLLLAAQVEVGERLVEQQQLGPGDQRVRDEHALLLAAGQLAHPGIGVPGRADVAEGPLDKFPALPRREGEAEPVPVKAERHHVAGAQRHVGVDDQLLRHVADAALVLVVQRLAVDEHPAARRLEQAEDDAQQRGLARAVRADDPGEVALTKRERHVAEHLAAAEPHARRRRVAAGREVALCRGSGGRLRWR